MNWEDVKLRDYFVKEEHRIVGMLAPVLVKPDRSEAMWVPDHGGYPFGPGVYRLKILVRTPHKQEIVHLAVETESLPREEALWEFERRLKEAYQRLLQPGLPFKVS